MTVIHDHAQGYLLTQSMNTSRHSVFVDLMFKIFEQKQINHLKYHCKLNSYLCYKWRLY